MFKFFKSIKEEITPKLQLTLEKYKAVFKTVDGEMHETECFNWGNPKGLFCSVPDYLMAGREYLTDVNGVKYPICNIISIEFILVKTMECIVKDEYGFGYGGASYKDNDEDIIEVISVRMM